MEKNDQDIVGREAVWSVHTSRSSATGSRAELETLPTAGNQGYDDPRESLSFVYRKAA